ncbi:hypothetical protein D3C87_1613220 [compost metagenome]|uniref:DUF2007 domain-containing protein n=1 Tax=Solitalea canadensis (strain ATCC 29591 / DSM 3403 / JCM 21819 / LMG 8368 / NBRC 15130 / NCIMB 12057 / USAM 9D) TaxID=929556 RepID=H8KLK7_SOLCM|nr:DUF2007 domain-containing protein [Solitalea canadensis]AFD08894.1 hypothetical protein Solca_3899 [Solitalea canadensis DSM 3403]
METNWIKIYTTHEWYKAELVSHLLEQENLEVVCLNKKDSSYLSFGAIELYVHQKDFTKAIEVIVLNEENPD